MVEDSSAPTTTMSATLDDRGDGRETKLAEKSAASTAAQGAALGTGGRTHEPGRGPDDIRAIVLAHRDDARGCYDRALEAHPAIEGDLTVTFTIDPRGHVIRARIDGARSQIADPEVVDCVTAIIKKLQFATSPGGFETTTSYPFDFHPRHGKRHQ